MILKNLSINSSYSAEFADLCGSSPVNNNANSSSAKTEEETSEDKTPKKRKMSSKKTKAEMAPLVFRMDGFMPGPSRA